MNITLEDLMPVLEKLEPMKSEKELIKFFEDLGRETYENGKAPKDLLGFNKKTLSELYSLAYELYNHGQYASASSIFYHLFMLNPRSPSYIYGVGACLSELKDYVLAINAFSLAYLNDVRDPTPLFFAADCALKIEQPKAAIGYLEQLLKTIEKTGGHSNLKTKATLMLTKLKEA